MLHWNHPLGLDCTSERPASYPGLLRPRDRATDAHFIPANDDHPLGTLGGSYSGASAINEKGQVIGSSNIAVGKWFEHAFLYSNGKMTDLSLGGTDSWAYDINEKGQVVGYSFTTGDLAVHAFLYGDGMITDLGTLGGTYSDAYDINEKGQVIGGSYTPGDSAWHTFLYSDGTMTDLTQMVFDLFLVDNFSGYDIRGGQIIGSCDWGGNMNACILTVPNK